MPALNAGKILVLDGCLKDLRRYQFTEGGAALELGTDRVYGATHQFGDDTRNIPERPLLGLSAQDEAEILDIFHAITKTSDITSEFKEFFNKIGRKPTLALSICQRLPLILLEPISFPGLSKMKISGQKMVLSWTTAPPPVPSSWCCARKTTRGP